jgi:NAD(P)-dependent dehydrogenase (short-subunit alcohol dehydrogenase family)
MSYNYQNKVALVTGATSGIGRDTAIAFAKAGAKVVLAGRREADGQAVVDEIKKAGGEAHFVRTDVGKESEVKALVDATLAKYGRLDIAFNNAGVEWAGPLTEATEKDYRHLFDTNVWSIITSMKYEVPAMLKTGGGAIVNTSSVAGHIGFPGASVYVATKHAVEGLTKTAALEFATQGIRVNAVAPAAIATDMVDRFVGKEGEQREYLKSLHPIGRLGRVEEITAAVLFLCSDEASFVTGESLKVDGALTAR